MRVKTDIEVQGVDVGIEVDIAMCDLIPVLNNASQAEVSRGLRQIAELLESIPDGAIEDMPRKQREITAGFLDEQSERFDL